MKNNMANPGKFVTIVERQLLCMPVDAVQDGTKVQLPVSGWGVECYE